MPPRSTWKGFLNLSLVSVAVRAFSAGSEGNQIRLNQLHAECNSRIKHRKICSQHGEISNDEIVMGYEYAKDQYVRITTDELDKIRGNVTRSIEVKSFIRPDAVSALHYTDSNYYLVPDGAAGQKPFQLIHRSMADLNVYAIAYAVLQKREHLVLIRPEESVLCMTVIRHAHAVKPAQAFSDEIAEVGMVDAEIDLAKTLIRETTDEAFELTQYKDEYTERLTHLIEAKVKGEEIVAAPAEQPRSVINLMEALKASVSQAQQAKAQSGSSGQQATDKVAKATDKPKPAKKRATKKKAARTTTAKTGTAKTGTTVLKASLAGKKKKKTAKKRKGAG